MTLRGSVNRDYTYNDDGDLQSMTNCYGTTQYEYDVFSNLKKVTFPSGKVIEYKVDGLNRRLKKLVNGATQEYYLWYDQTRIAAILDENKNPKLVYLYGPEIPHVPSYVIKNGVSYRILHDPGLGSIRYIINPSTREIMQEIEYDEYGNMTKNTDPTFQPLTFAGGLWDSDTKFIRFGARDYDPTIGRWTTKDPIGFAGGDTNLYGYVGANPMSFRDSNGMFPKNITEARDCLHGNYQATVQQLQDNINANQARINELNKNKQASSNENKCLPPKKEDEEENRKKMITHLTNLNKSLNEQLNQLKEKCSFFPTID